MDALQNIGCELLAACFIGLGHESRNLLVDDRLVLQTDLGLIVAVRRNAPGREVALGIIGRPPGERVLHVELARALAVQVRLLLLADDLHVDADAAQISLHDFGDRLFLRVLGVEVEGHFAALAILHADAVPALLPACLLHKLVGSCPVKLAGLEGHVAPRNILRKERLGSGFAAVENAFDDGVAVHGMLDCLAHGLVARDFTPGIEQNRAACNRPAHGGHEPALPLQLVKRVACQLISVRAEHEVDLALLQGKQHRLGIGQNVPADGLKEWLFAPVVCIAPEDGVLVALVLLNNPGTGSRKAGDSVLGPSVLHALRGDEAEGTREAELDQRRKIGVLEGQPEGVLAQRLRPLDLVDHVEPGVTGSVRKNGIDVLLDALSREGRSVRILHSLSEAERVHAAIRGNLPALGKPWLDSVMRVHDKRLEDHRLRGHLSEIQMRIDVADVLHARIVEVAFWRRRGIAARRGKDKCRSGKD